jgi:predicted amidophosphoribosyltransferase
MAAVEAGAADVVTWVPLARARKAERGFDQARALALVVARELDLPARGLLRRVGRTDPQAKRTGAERREAMRGRFAPAAVAGPPVPPRVLLVDDVLTTGATAAACADALTSAGAREVSVLAAARAFPGRSYTRVGSRAGLWLPGEEVPR